MIKIFPNRQKQLAQALEGFFIITLQQFNDTVMHDALCQHLFFFFKIKANVTIHETVKRDRFFKTFLQFEEFTNKMNVS